MGFNNLLGKIWHFLTEVLILNSLGDASTRADTVSFDCLSSFH